MFVLQSLVHKQTVKQKRYFLVFVSNSNFEYNKICIYLVKHVQHDTSLCLGRSYYEIKLSRSDISYLYEIQIDTSVMQCNLVQNTLSRIPNLWHVYPEHQRFWRTISAIYSNSPRYWITERLNIYPIYIPLTLY